MCGIHPLSHSPDPSRVWIIVAHCRSFTGCLLALTGFVYNVLWFYVVHRYITVRVWLKKRKGHSESDDLSLLISYLIAAVLAFCQRSIVLYIIHSLFYLLPGIIDKQLIEKFEITNL